MRPDPRQLVSAFQRVERGAHRRGSRLPFIRIVTRSLLRERHGQ
jgi:hypothetical protein